MGHVLIGGMPTLQSSGHIVAHGRPLHRFFRILPSTLGLWWEIGRVRICFQEELRWGDQPLDSQFPGPFKIVTLKNLPISSILGSSYHFSWNFNFRHKLSNFEIEDLERLITSLTHLHLSPFAPNARVWLLFSQVYLQ